MKFSYSRIKMWVECPKKYRAVYVDKCVPKTTSPAMQRGIEMHAKLEQAIKTGVPPDGIALPPGMIEGLHKAGAQAEVGLGITEDGKLCTDGAGPAFLGGYLDVLVKELPKASVWDWKTGKFNPDPLQADVYATLVRANTLATEVEFVWVYIDQKKSHRLSPDQHAQKRVFDLIRQIEADKEYPPSPNQYCRYCPVTDCRYHP